jgi:hypothetical protein
VDYEVPVTACIDYLETLYRFKTHHMGSDLRFIRSARRLGSTR